MALSFLSLRLVRRESVQEETKNLGRVVGCNVAGDK